MITQTLAVAYAATGITLTIGFIPQILTLLTSPGRAVSFSLATWALWSANTIITFFYMLVLNGDITAITISAVSMLGTLAIFSLVCYKRYAPQVKQKPVLMLPLTQPILEAPVLEPMMDVVDGWVEPWVEPIVTAVTDTAEDPIQPS